MSTSYSRHGFDMLASGNYIAIDGPVEIVSFPREKMDEFPYLCVTLPEGTLIGILAQFESKSWVMVNPMPKVCDFFAWGEDGTPNKLLLGWLKTESWVVACGGPKGQRSPWLVTPATHTQNSSLHNTFKHSAKSSD